MKKKNEKKKKPAKVVVQTNKTLICKHAHSQLCCRGCALHRAVISDDSLKTRSFIQELKIEDL